MTLFGPKTTILSVAYATMCWEALLTASQTPRTLPLIRAAVLYALHHGAVNDRLDQDTYWKLNDAMFYAGFTLFPVMTGFPNNGVTLNELIVPGSYLWMSVEGNRVGKDKAKALAAGETPEPGTIDVKAEVEDAP